MKDLRCRRCGAELGPLTGRFHTVQVLDNDAVALFNHECEREGVWRSMTFSIDCDELIRALLRIAQKSKGDSHG